MVRPSASSEKIRLVPIGSSLGLDFETVVKAVVGRKQINVSRDKDKQIQFLRFARQTLSILDDKDSVQQENNGGDMDEIPRCQKSVQHDDGVGVLVAPVNPVVGRQRLELAV
eukprot:scaffold227_cov165-Amphora_coffeaeformis.AAC.30